MYVTIREFVVGGVVSREKMADPYRETVVQEVQNGFVPYLRDTILPDRAKQRNDTRLSTSPRPRISFFSVRVNINLHSALATWALLFAIMLFVA